MEEKIVAYKGFDENLRCGGFQYEIGKEYEQKDEIKCCSKGFHACTNPFDVLNYYDANGKNRFCEVEQSGTIETDNSDTKQASSKIKIKAEIGMSGLFKAGIEWIKEKTNPVTIIEDAEKIGTVLSGDYAKIGSSGGYAKINSTGKYAVICCAGDNSMVKAKIGSWITLAEWDYSEEKKCPVPVCVKTEYVDGKRIKADTWYKLVNGEFKEV